MTEDDDLIAAEYALGLLSPDEAAQAEARSMIDIVLATRIAWWRDQLGQLVDELAVEAPPGLWRRIEARLGANDNQGSLRRWQWATGVMSAAAAVLLGVVVLRPEPAPVALPAPAPAPMLANVAGAAGTMAVSYDRFGGRLVVVPGTFERGVGDAELWIIPAGDGAVPRSLGVVDAVRPESHTVPMTMRPLMRVGATLAVTHEREGGSPSGAPQGPVVASGKIIMTST